MADWSRPFEDPITLPDGRTLSTLRGAGDYVAELPEAEHMTAKWQAAMLALMLVVELNGPTMMARIGIMRAEAATALRRTYAVFFKNNDYVGGSNVGHD
jgi:hypothetical protein